MAKTKEKKTEVKLVEIFKKKKSLGIVVISCNTGATDATIKDYVHKHVAPATDKSVTYRIITDPTQLPIGYADRVMTELSDRIEYLQSVKLELATMFLKPIFNNARKAKPRAGMRSDMGHVCKKQYGIKIRRKDNKVSEFHNKNAIWHGGKNSAYMVEKKRATRFKSKAAAEKHISDTSIKGVTPKMFVEQL